MSKITILMLFGGESSEHEVSIASARNVYNALDKNMYDVLLCYIDKQGRWWHTGRVEAQVQPNNELTAIFGTGEFVTRYGEHLKPQVLLSVLHGQNGEDGSVQGVAQLMHLPIIGCGVTGSAVCMDKDITKRLLMQEGIPVVANLVHYREDPDLDYDKVSQQLSETLFVKPANLGSSIGVSKVSDAESFRQAIHAAHQYDHKVIIERAVTGREIECAVLGNDNPQASVLGEIFLGEEFYTYDDKYAENSKATTVVDADLPDQMTDYIRGLALRVYKALECRGLARIDFFLSENGEVYVNEANTLPGFTDISMYPKLWMASGLSYGQLLDRLVQLALQEYTSSTKRGV